MPKAKTATKETSKLFEKTRWDSGEFVEYKHVVLSLILLKFISNKFEQRRAELVVKSKKDHLETLDFYTMRNVFLTPENSKIVLRQTDSDFQFAA